VRSAKIKLSFDRNLPARPQGWSNPIVPGDHPDPTIVRIGDTFWASATSGEWSPQFPLFRSTDLVHWEPSGSIFPNQPAWAEGSFWAPELVHDELSQRFFVFYVARKRGGPLCIALATALTPEGPYVDRGPMVCEEDGSIDPCFARDEHGEPYLIWKEDGNSVGRATPIWAQRLSEDFLSLIGEKTQLLVADQPWEDGLIEGPYILRHELRFYLFYAGNSCCGRECKYAEGVARSDRLLGPWEKFPGNPLIAANDRWRCPGHGTAVHADASAAGPATDYLLYHAYPVGGTVYVGREAILDEVAWSVPDPDGRPGWPIVNSGLGPAAQPRNNARNNGLDPIPSIDFIDDFVSPTLGLSWQWPVNTHPDIHISGGALTLGIPLHSPLSERPVESAMIAVPRPPGLKYQASVIFNLPGESQPTLWAGLSIVGDPFNTIGLGVRGNPDRSGNELILWQRRGDTQVVIWQAPAPGSTTLHLRAQTLAPQGPEIEESFASEQTAAEHRLQFFFSTDGQSWNAAGTPYDASDLPAWDRGLRIGLMLEGPCGLSATFRSFELRAR
jgi:xylan 1,4-beta-xylosidase